MTDTIKPPLPEPAYPAARVNGNRVWTEPEVRAYADAAVAQAIERCALIVQSNAEACAPGTMTRNYLESNVAAIRALKEPK